MPAGLSPERRSLPIVARCVKCGREFVSLGGSDIDGYPPREWQPQGGWSRWRGEDNEDVVVPICGGRIVLVDPGRR